MFFPDDRKYPTIANDINSFNVLFINKLDQGPTTGVTKGPQPSHLFAK